jgi:hypothetical protein
MKRKGHLTIVKGTRAPRRNPAIPKAPSSLPKALRSKWIAYATAIIERSRERPSPGIWDSLALYLRHDLRVQKSADPTAADLSRHYKLQLALGLISPIAAPQSSAKAPEPERPSVNSVAWTNAARSGTLPIPRGRNRFANNFARSLALKIARDPNPERRATMCAQLEQLCADNELPLAYYQKLAASG